MNVKEKMELLKVERINEIINDASLTKIEKLKTLEEEKLFGYSPYINNEFPEWEAEVIELEKIEAERILKEGSSDPHEICARQFYQSKMTDTIFDPSNFYYDKYELVSYAEALENMVDFDMDSYDDKDDYPNDGKIVIITTRHPYTKLRKPVQEVIDKVYEFCIKNKVIGFKNDW